jgi:hypothetical protein
VATAGISVPVVLIAEMLLLVAVDDNGHVPVGNDAFVKVGLTGALLAELAVDGKLMTGMTGGYGPGIPGRATSCWPTSTTPCATTWKARRPGRSSAASAVTSAEAGIAWSTG